VQSASSDLDDYVRQEAAADKLVNDALCGRRTGLTEDRDGAWCLPGAAAWARFTG
jgi:hypothetical protein